jgi:hypothetical protein
MAMKMRASRKQLACDIPPTKRKFFAKKNPGAEREMRTGTSEKREAREANLG